MNKIVKKAVSAMLVCAMAVSVSACGKSGGTDTSDGGQADPETTIAETAAAEKSNWDELDGAQITAAMGMGWNLGNQLEASSNGTPSETAWGNPEIKKELIDTVKAQGFNTVRIPVSYLSKIGEAPDYTIDAAWLERVREVVDYVVDNDMYAIINLHGDGYYTVQGGWLLCVDENQTEIKAKYEAVWAQISEYFKDYDEHLIFESMNEVFDGTYGNPNPDGYANINDYNRIFTETVRKTGGNNAKRWLLIPGWNTNIQHTTSDSFVIPEDSLCESDGKRLMISVHYYDPYNFTLDENLTSLKTQWGKYAVENYDNWGQEDYVDSQMQLLNTKFVSQGYPVVIGELGAEDRTYAKENSAGYRRYWCEYVVKAAKANGCIPVYWDNGWNGKNGFGLFNRLTNEVTQPEIIEAMIRAISAEGDYEIEAPSAE